MTRCAAESQHLAAKAVAQAAGSALLLKAAAAERAGAPGLATAHALAHLLCHSAGAASAEERAVAHAQILRLAADQRGYRAAEQVAFLLIAASEGAFPPVDLLSKSTACTRADLEIAACKGHAFPVEP
jgi:hypothetical protein